MNRTDWPVRPALTGDIFALAPLRADLWPDGTPEHHAEELGRAFKGQLHWVEVILVAESAGRIIGFAELSLRSTVNGCESTPVGYLEGWYVVPEFRHRGVGRALVAAGEAWARMRGCTEFGSDADYDNLDSAAAHRALGFEEEGVVRTFRKRLLEG